MSIAARKRNVKRKTRKSWTPLESCRCLSNNQGTANIETSQEGVPEFGRRHRLALALEYAELSHQDAADRLGVSRQTIANWVSGRTFPKDFALKAVALMCGVDPQWLLTGNPAKSPSDTHNRAGKPMCAPSDSNREPAGNDIIILHTLQDAA